jgi:hypothetical protein
MAIAWLSVLKIVPWGDVIENAPKVAQGAKKLWNTVSKKSDSGHASPTDAHNLVVNDTEKLVALQAEVAELQQQMLASSELIQSLASQNAQLIKRVETNRKRVLWLAAAWLALTIGVAIRWF